MTKLNEAGRSRIAETQAALGRAKDALRDVAREMRKLGAEDRAEGALDAANACNRLEGAAYQALGIIVQAHARASDDLLKYHDEDAGDIIAMGGGGGR